jgi:hypothetical protein
MDDGEILALSVHYMQFIFKTDVTFEIDNLKKYLLTLEYGRTLPPEWGELVSPQECG